MPKPAPPISLAAYLDRQSGGLWLLLYSVFFLERHRYVSV